MNLQSSSAAANRRHAGQNLGMVATVYPESIVKTRSEFDFSL
jgi:hypothetical protein